MHGIDFENEIYRFQTNDLRIMAKVHEKSEYSKDFIEIFLLFRLHHSGCRYKTHTIYYMCMMAWPREFENIHPPTHTHTHMSCVFCTANINLASIHLIECWNHFGTVMNFAALCWECINDQFLSKNQPKR